MTILKSHDLMFLKSVHPRNVMQREYEEAYQEALHQAIACEEDGPSLDSLIPRKQWAIQ